MTKNVGGRDRTARIILGLVSVAAMMVTLVIGEPLGDQTQAIVAAALLLLAFASLGTAGAEKCPINRTLGRNTFDDGATGERP